MRCWRRYPLSDTSLPARYARAISAYRFGDLHSAIAQIDSLIQAMPNNPYFYELKGQALLEGGHPAEAIPPLRRAVQLRADPALIQILLGTGAGRHQRSEAAGRGDPAAARRADQGARRRRRLQDAGDGLWRKNDFADADLASAQAAFARGDNKTARELAERAKQRFPIGSPGWVRADDIVAFNKNQKDSPLRIGQ